MRAHLSYANVMATISVFVAMGGTSYAALTLPRDSVGARQIKSGAIGGAELRRGAVASRAIKNGGVQSQDLSSATRIALRGEPGPPGPPGPAGAGAVSLRAALDSGGGVIAGNATFSGSSAANKRLVGFSRSVAGCVPTATLARNAGGGIIDPGAGHVVVAIEGDKVAVETYNAAGAPKQLPFNLIVSC